MGGNASRCFPNVLHDLCTMCTIYLLTHHFTDFMATHALAIHNLYRAQWTGENMQICEKSIGA